MPTNDQSIYERVAVLEDQMKDIEKIKEKLDELLTLKSKGAGALWLMGLILTSGVLGLIATFTNMFKHGH